MSKHSQAKGVALSFLALPIAAAALMTVAIVTGPSEYQVEQAQLTDYCQAVQQWNAEAARGIEPTKRFGHPDYDRKADQCTSYTSASEDEIAVR